MKIIRQSVKKLLRGGNMYFFPFEDEGVTSRCNFDGNDRFNRSQVFIFHSADLLIDRRVVDFTNGLNHLLLDDYPDRKFFQLVLCHFGWCI